MPKKKKDDSRPKKEPVEVEAKMTVVIHDKGSMFLRHEVGSAKGSDGTEYEMSADFGSMMPIITSKKTGKIAVMRWQNMIDAAVNAGIDEERSRR